MILIVAVIAVSRHIIQLDFEHADGFVLIGIGALVISLTAGYFLVRWGTLSNPLRRIDP